MFVAGADLNELRRRTVGESLARLNQRLFQQVHDHPWPTIAVVDGWALGGGFELALACDFRLSTAEAVWGLPEVRLGIIPSGGALCRLEALIGRSRATELILTGSRIDGSRAYEIGLVQRLANRDGLELALDDLVGALGRTSMQAVRLAKEAMRVRGDRHRMVDATAQALCIASDDTQARIAAQLGATSAGTS
jgi:enoyl-CoA hydratase/carnithine racemase